MQAEHREPRGVFNPRVIDLITLDEAADEVVLVMLEQRPWDDDPAQLRQLEAKFNAYLSYVLGGYLVQQYPAYADRGVRFQLDCVENPRAADAAFFTAMSNFAVGEGIRLVVRVMQPGEEGLRSE
ncbi:MAG TPA: DUF6572 domain-containing protein [Myxococcota bacterium]|nr:DUF6572 domain-containing protein [Myxococcota bacterium]